MHSLFITNLLNLFFWKIHSLIIISPISFSSSFYASFWSSSFCSSKSKFNSFIPIPLILFSVNEYSLASTINLLYLSTSLPVYAIKDYIDSLACGKAVINLGLKEVRIHLSISYAAHPVLLCVHHSEA